MASNFAVSQAWMSAFAAAGRAAAFAEPCLPEPGAANICLERRELSAAELVTVPVTDAVRTLPIGSHMLRFLELRAILPLDVMMRAPIRIFGPSRGNQRDIGGAESKASDKDGSHEVTPFVVTQRGTNGMP